MTNDHSIMMLKNKKETFAVQVWQINSGLSVSTFTVPGTGWILSRWSSWGQDDRQRLQISACCPNILASPRLCKLNSNYLELSSFDHCVIFSPNCAWVLERSMGPRNRVEIGLSYRPVKTRFFESEESIPPDWESIPGLLKRFTNTGSHYIDWRNSLELIPGLLISLEIRLPES